MGEKVALGPLCKDLSLTYQRWFNDFRILRALGGIAVPLPLTLEQEQQWYERAVTRNVARLRVFFTIFELGTGRPMLANTGLHGIDYRNGTAEFTIAIGEPDARGKGYGTEATQLMLDYAFTRRWACTT